jgi:hypothetical protein
VAQRFASADPPLGRALGAATAGDSWPRLVARNGPPPRIAVLAAGGRTLERLTRAARHSGWSVLGASAQSSDPLAMTKLVLRRDVGTVLVGAQDPPGPDERPVLADLAEVVAAAAGRRPELSVVLSGALAEYAERFERSVEAPEVIDEYGVEVPRTTPIRPTLLLAPSPTAGDPPGEALRSLLDELRAPADDGRRAMVRTIGSLARRLERRVEAIDIGHQAGLRVAAWPAGAGGRAHIRWVHVADAALVPEPVEDDIVDGVLAWSTLQIDRYRLRDRLAELRLAPWSGADGDGAQLRLAAARAALGRLVAASPELDRPVPDLVAISGGAWAIGPGAAVGLAVADVIRRSGASQLGLDHARLLGPIGTIADDVARDAMVGDLADDLLAPLGSLVIPAGLRSGRSAGRLFVHAQGGTTELDLVPGGLELVDLPPGESAVADFRFRDTVVLGARGKRFALDVSGGLGGLLVDLRDVPLRLPDRAERRRELLDAWQRALWVGMG